MLPGLSALELGRLRMSVGYGGHKKGRLLSPVEAGLLLCKAIDAGSSLEKCAEEVNLDKTGIRRFQRLTVLPEDLRHLIVWGPNRDDGIGFSTAVELSKIKDPDEQISVSTTVLANKLSSKETRYLIQLLERTGRTIDDCLLEILNLRPTIEKRYVFIGSVNDLGIQNSLAKLTQNKRDSILVLGIAHLELQGATGRLGKQVFTLVGDERFNESMKRIGKDSIETRLRNYISETVENATSDC